MTSTKIFLRSAAGGLCVAMAALASPAGAQTQVQVGSVAAADPTTSRQPAGGQPINLSVSDNVFMRDIMRTSIGGKLQVKFIDGSDMTLNSGSEVTIDEYVYQPQSGSGARAVINVGGGVLRFVSGKTEKDGVTFKTPTSTMGIRGTDIVIRVDITGASRVDVISGIVTMQPCGRSGGSEPYVAKAGEALIVDTNCGVSAAAANADTGAPSAGPGPGAASAGPGGAAGPGGGTGGTGGPGNGNGNGGNSGNGGGNSGGSGPGTGNGGGNGNGNGNGGAGNGGAGGNGGGNGNGGGAGAGGGGAGGASL